MRSLIASIRVILLLLVVGFAVLVVAIVPSNAAVQYQDRGKAGLNSRLVNILYQVEKKFGRRLIVVSGCRSRAHNRRIGGARESYHLRCMAADIIVPGVRKSELYRYLAGHPGRGGLGSYCRSPFVHVDVGPRREWSWGCGRGSKNKKRRNVRLPRRR
jgi:uncharacterized protein YcbK (DUF882 family)